MKDFIFGTVRKWPGVGNRGGFCLWPTSTIATHLRPLCLFQLFHDELFHCLRFRTSHPGWRPWKNHLHHWHRPHWSHGYRFCRHKHHTRAPHVRERSDPHRLPCAAHPDRDRPDDFKQEWKRREIWRKWVFTTRLTVEKLFCHSCRLQ